uniref:Uncharacterized protein n=1 Tax=Parascaris equorum TaxID=6256 RepID=A0A914RFL7_PAREQ
LQLSQWCDVAHTSVSNVPLLEKPTDEQKDSGKPAPEIKPKVIARNAKEVSWEVVCSKGDYPTMDDVLSDWDSEKEKKVIMEQDQSLP